MTVTQTFDSTVSAPRADLAPPSVPAAIVADIGRDLDTATRTLPLRGPLLACAAVLAIFAALGLAFGFLHVLYTPRRAALVASALLLVMHR